MQSAGIGPCASALFAASQGVWQPLCGAGRPRSSCSVWLRQLLTLKSSDVATYSFNDHRNALLVRLHLKERLDLSKGEVLPVAQCDQFVKGAEQLKGVFEDFSLVQAAADAGNNLRKQVERVNVLENIALTVGDEDHVELVQRLVDVADIVLLDCGMLRASIGKLGEGS